ncbi:MAG: hypothetical protein U0744_21405 [Gemmataceae bacterium]
MRRMLLILAMVLTPIGCAFGPRILEKERTRYNEAVKITTEEQMLLNIVRLRYNDSPTNVAVSTIASQYAFEKSIKAVPFFAATGDVIPTAFSTVLPDVELLAANRPTISFTPQDDAEFSRRMFTPLTLEGFTYLTKTSWPVSTMFRVWVEKVNWVPNAPTASGPTPKEKPNFEEFLHAVKMLQTLEDRDEFNFFVEEKVEEVSGPIKVDNVTSSSVVDAVKNNMEFRKDADGKTMTLVKKTKEPVIRIHPRALESFEVQEFERVFGLQPKLGKYTLEVEAMDPYRANQPKEGAKILDLELRSLLQALFYVSQGVDIPPEHAALGLATITRDHDGRGYDYGKMLEGLFRVRSCCGKQKPCNALVSVCYKGCWFYIADDDQDTKATFALLVGLARLDQSSRPGAGPVLTLPIGAR